jgi:hypothetical protein
MRLRLRPCGRHPTPGPGVPICSTLLRSIGPVQDGIVRVGAGVTGRHLRAALPEWTSDLPPDQTSGSWAIGESAQFTAVTDTGEMIDGHSVYSFIVSVAMQVRPAEYTAQLVDNIDEGLALLRSAAQHGQRAELTDDQRIPDYIWRPLFERHGWLVLVENIGGGARRSPDPAGWTFDLSANWETARRTARLARDTTLKKAYSSGWKVQVILTIITTPGHVVVRCCVTGGDTARLERAAREGVAICSNDYNFVSC